MSAFFASASSQKLSNASPPITGYPFTVGIWVCPTTTGADKAIFSLNSGSSTTNRFDLFQSSFGTWRLEAADAGSSTIVGGIPTAGQWDFICGRFISATNRRISTLGWDGAITHGATTVNRAPVGITTSELGTRAGTQYFDGAVAEYWILNVDVQPDGAQLTNETLHRLAYGGPFSVPHIAKDIIEYRSFRKYPASDGDDASEVYHGARGRQVWVNTGGVTIGPHPPLPYWYAKPGQTRAELVI